jgi:beta-glucan synthesis-associated protein KRE6
MSSHSNSSSSSPPRVPPHIRLNSGHEDLLSGDGNSSSRTLVPTASRPTTSRSQLNAVYSQEHVQDSAERLLPPGPVGSRRHGESPMRSPARSSYSSRRSSWESDRSRDSRGFENPFRDSSQSRPGSRAGSDDNDVNTQTVSEKFNILPSAGLLLFPEDVEKDDYLHNPDPNDKDRDCDIFNKRGLVNIGGLLFITLGILALFVGYPILYAFLQTRRERIANEPTEPLYKNSHTHPILAKKPTPVLVTARYLCSRTCVPVSSIPTLHSRQ